MAKPAADNCATFDAPRPFDEVLRLGSLTTQAPAALSHRIYLGIRLTPEADALAEVVWIVSDPGHAVHATVCARRSSLLEDIRRQLGAWFDSPTYIFRLPLAAPRTLFQARLRNALCATRSGETLTYGDLAKQLHSAPRAVGQALGSNPLPLIVPCHRIISAGKNRLTGFNHVSDGPMLTLKAWLLEREAHA